MNPTVGVEIELLGVDPTTITSYMPECRYAIHDDRTVRRANYVCATSGLALVSTELMVPTNSRNGGAFGTELVIGPHSVEEMLNILTELSEWIGHLPAEGDTSVHIHVDVGNKSWRYIQNLVLWCYALEAYLYRLAAGGGVHRGEVNSYQYVRPLSCPITRDDMPLIKMQMLANARSATGFVAAWGRLDLFWNNRLYRPGHYIPHRLHGWNLHSVLRRGTFEWRLNNGIYEHMPLLLNIALAVHKLAVNPVPGWIKPVILGMEADNRSFIEDLLQLDLSKLWGNRTPGFPDLVFLEGHYRNFTQQLYNTTDYPPAVIYNNSSYDDGSDEFPLYVRM